MSIDNYLEIKPLGDGEFSKVVLLKDSVTNHFYAGKILEKNDNPQIQKYIDSEISILNELEHPNIVKFYEVKEKNTSYYLITEYYNGETLLYNLDEYKEKYKKPFDEKLVQYLMKQIISGIKYLHDKNIVHRDIKPTNILLHFSSEKDLENKDLFKANIKIIDFGFSRHLSKSELAYSILGSPLYMEPIILKKLYKCKDCNEKGYESKCDIWSLGVLCYEMLTGKSPFNADNMKELVKNVDKGNYFLPTNLSEEAISFINGMLQYDPNTRYDIDDLYNHPFLNKPYSEFTKINLDKYAKNIINTKIKMNTKSNNNVDNQTMNDKVIKELKEEISKFKNIIEQLNTTILELRQQLTNEKKYINEINELKKIIKQNDEELNKLKESVKDNNIQNQININKVKCVNIITADQNISFAIPCSDNSIFAEIEELLYREYPEYRETNNSFLSNGKEILRFKTIKDNNIGTGKPIMMVSPSKK